MIDLPNGAPSIVLVTDADNTLWDTDSFYEAAQLALLRRVESVAKQTASGEPLEFVRNLDRQLMKRFGTWAYPAHELSNALYLALADRDPADSVSEQLREFANEFQTSIRAAIPKLRPGAKATLEQLARSGASIYVATEGKLEKARAWMAHHQIESLVAGLLNPPDKTAPSWVDELRQLAGKADVAVFVGDQVSRDLVPANRAGYLTAYFPSGYRTHTEIDVEYFRPTISIMNYGDLLPLISEKRQTRRLA